MAQIRSIHDVHSARNLEEIDVPEWGGSLFVKALSSGVYERWQLGLLAQPKNDKPHVTIDRIRNSNAKLVVLGACDENGAPIFTDADIPALADEDNKGMAKVAEAIQRLTGIGDYAESAVTMVKNSETDQDSDSHTD